MATATRDKRATMVNCMFAVESKIGCVKECVDNGSSGDKLKRRK